MNHKAVLNGYLVRDGGLPPCSCGFEWGETIAYGNTTITQNKLMGESFWVIITGLDSLTTYHFRAFATNSIGTAYGDDKSFATGIAEVVAASVVTLPATMITEHAARINGMIEEDADKFSYVRFQWGLTKEYGANTTWVGGFVEGMAFFVDLNELAEGTGYHFRAQLKQDRIVSGNDMVFSTLSPMGPLTLMTEDQAYLLEASA